MKLQNEMFTVVGGDAECPATAGNACQSDKIQVRLNADHLIYQAHFPGNPITPGVCIVQMVGELLSERLGRQLSLGRIVNLKFVAPISPLENPDLTVCFSSVEDNGMACKAKGTIMAGEGVKTKFSIIFENHR